MISLKEIDAQRLGYYEQEKWKSLLENRLPSIAEKLNVKFQNLQYVGQYTLKRDIYTFNL